MPASKRASRTRGRVYFLRLVWLLGFSLVGLSCFWLPAPSSSWPRSRRARTIGAVTFAGPGCLSSKGLQKCEGTITKALGTFVRNVVVCHTRQADAAFSTQQGKPKAFDEEVCEETNPSMRPTG